MICIKCYLTDYKTVKINRRTIINGKEVLIPDVECEKCPKCGDILFTHDQSIELEKKRLIIENKEKTILTITQLVILRKSLNMSQEEISEYLQIGKNTYGRWERGEADITPSMNLLVHSLIDKFPFTRINLFEDEMIEEVRKTAIKYSHEHTSLGQFVRSIIDETKILPEVIALKLDLSKEELTTIENNEIKPDCIPLNVAVSIITFFNLSIDKFKLLLENSLKIIEMKVQVSSIYARQATYGSESTSSQTRTLNKVFEALSKEKKMEKSDVIDEYVNKVAKKIQEERGPTR